MSKKTVAATTTKKRKTISKRREKSRVGRFCSKLTSWRPCPARAYAVEEVSPLVRRTLLVVTGVLMVSNFSLICIDAMIIHAQRGDPAPHATFSIYILSFSTVVLFVGLVCFVFSLCGFIGVLRENIVLVRAFYISLIVLLCVQLVLLVLSATFALAGRAIIGNAISADIVKNYRDNTDIEATIDYLQAKFECCGLSEEAFNDWNASIYFKCSADNPSTERCGVPWSCCRKSRRLHDPLCGSGVQNLDRNIATRKVYTRGCMLAVSEWCIAHVAIIAFLLLLQIIVLVVMILQSVQVVNELQMMTGTYRGPWWIRVAKKRKSEKLVDKKESAVLPAAGHGPARLITQESRESMEDLESEFITESAAKESELTLGERVADHGWLNIPNVPEVFEQPGVSQRRLSEPVSDRPPSDRGRSIARRSAHRKSRTLAARKSGSAAGREGRKTGSAAEKEARSSNTEQSSQALATRFFSLQEGESDQGSAQDGQENEERPDGVERQTSTNRTPRAYRWSRRQRERRRPAIQPGTKPPE